MYPLQGQYSVILQNGGSGEVLTPVDAWISQTGDVPSDARSLMFSTDYAYSCNIVVSLNGTAISTSLYSVGAVVNANGGPVQTYIGDISAFAGQQNVVLRFETVPTGDPYRGAADLDAITFSPISVPEPASLVLLAAAFFSLAGYYWHRRNSATAIR